jgi:hypothetical protein
VRLNSIRITSKEHTNRTPISKNGCTRNILYNTIHTLLFNNETSFLKATRETRVASSISSRLVVSGGAISARRGERTRSHKATATATAKTKVGNIEVTFSSQPCSSIGNNCGLREEFTSAPVS